MSILESVKKPEADANTSKTVDRTRLEPRNVLSQAAGGKLGMSDQRLYTHTVDGASNTIYFGVDNTLLFPECLDQLPPGAIIGVLQDPISEEFYIQSCQYNFPHLQEPGISGKSLFYVTLSGEITHRPVTQKDYPVMGVKFASIES